MKKLCVLTLVLTMTLASGCTNVNLPGSFPETSVFKEPFEKKLSMSNFHGHWRMIANGRVRYLDITGNENQLIINKSSLGDITEVRWVKESNKFTFKRTVAKNGKEDIEQFYTGYLMEYPKDGAKDDKWRIAGTYEQKSPTIDKPVAGWYATRPRE